MAISNDNGGNRVATAGNANAPLPETPGSASAAPRPSRPPARAEVHDAVDKGQPRPAAPSVPSTPLRAAPPQPRTVRVQSSATDATSRIVRGLTPGALIVRDPQEMVARLLETVPPGSLRKLELTAHARPGEQHLDGSSLILAFDRTTDQHYIAVSSNDSLAPNFEAELARLRPLFTADAVVELGGCAVGATERGREFVARLSSVLGVTVKAADYYQAPLIPGREGRTVTGTPSENGATYTVTGRAANPLLRLLHIPMALKDYEGLQAAGDGAAKVAQRLSGREAARAWQVAAEAYNGELNPRAAARAHAHAIAEFCRDIDPREASPADGDRVRALLSSLAALDADPVAALAEAWPSGREPDRRAAVFLQLGYECEGKRRETAAAAARRQAAP